VNNQANKDCKYKEVKLYGSRKGWEKDSAPMRRYFYENSLTFFKEELVHQSDLKFPLYLNIEPSLECDSHCVMCPRTKSKRPIGNMDWALYNKIIHQILEYGPTKVVTFHKDGEPLMHPRLEDMIKYGKKSGAMEFTHFNTNAFSLDEERARKLLDCGVDDITMSIDAVTEETFWKVKGCGSLAEVERNVLRLLELRRKKNQNIPWIRCKIIAMDITENEIELFITRWSGVADEVQVQEVHNYGGAVEYMPQIMNRYPCQSWWYTMAINWDGTVSICSVDYSGLYPLGDIKKNSLKDIWNGSKIKNARKALLAGNYNDVPICKNCTVWQVGPDMTDWYRQMENIL
jgi:radical SAM protein with 4Fe4S-binding SPASM domain